MQSSFPHRHAIAWELAIEGVIKTDVAGSDPPSIIATVLSGKTT
jgi:hypothetical protein